MTDILDPDYESDLTEDDHNQLVLMSEHAIAPPLSPAAQAVLDAFRSSHTGQGCLAAALRAAVDYTKVHPGHDMWQCDANELLAIANEIEAQ